MDDISNGRRATEDYVYERSSDQRDGGNDGVGGGCLLSEVVSGPAGRSAYFTHHDQVDDENKQRQDQEQRLKRELSGMPDTVALHNVDDSCRNYCDYHLARDHFHRPAWGANDCRLQTDESIIPRVIK